MIWLSANDVVKCKYNNFLDTHSYAFSNYNAVFQVKKPMKMLNKAQ